MTDQLNPVQRRFVTDQLNLVRASVTEQFNPVRASGDEQFNPVRRRFELNRKRNRKRGQVSFLRCFHAVLFGDAQNPPRLPCE